MYANAHIGTYLFAVFGSHVTVAQPLTRLLHHRVDHRAAKVVMALTKEHKYHKIT